MNVPLAAYRLLSQSSTCVHDDAKEQHPLVKLVAVIHAAHVHCDCIDGIGPAAIRIAETGANGIEPAIFRPRPEYTVSIMKIHTASVETYGKTGIESGNDGGVRRTRGSQLSLRTRDGFPLRLSIRAPNPKRRITS